MKLWNKLQEYPTNTLIIIKDIIEAILKDRGAI